MMKYKFMARKVKQAPKLIFQASVIVISCKYRCSICSIRYIVDQKTIYKCKI